MFENIIDALEDMLEEIDSLVESVQCMGPSLEERAESHFLQWSANGSILDGGRSIRMESFGLEGVHNVYDVLSSMEALTNCT